MAKGEVTIYYRGPGNVLIDPYMGELDRNHQKMKWTLVDETGTGVQFAVPGGVTFPWPLNPPPTPPPTYSEWQGDVPTGDATEYRADAKFKVPHGSPNVYYLYYFTLETPSGTEVVTKVRALNAKAAGLDEQEVFDPPIENEPQP